MCSMASRKRGRDFASRIEDRGGVDWVVAEVGTGRSLRSIASEIGCGRWWLDRWLYARPEAQARITRARARVAAPVSSEQPTTLEKERSAA